MTYQLIEENIVYFPDAIADPDELLRQLELTEIETDQSAVTPWSPWTGYGSDYQYGLRKWAEWDKLDHIENPTASSRYVIETIVNAMESSAKQYSEIFGLNKTATLGKEFVINQYDTGQGMGPHVDWNKDNDQLEYSFVVYLNDNYTGGEIVWPNQDVMLKPKAGSIVIFPSKEPYVHKVNDVTLGNKIFVPHFWHTDGFK